jgi:hypothetical protein
MTAIELFTGQPPYYDLPPVPAAFKISKDAATPLPERASSDFRSFIECCLNKDPRFRKSALDLLSHRFIRIHSSDPNDAFVTRVLATRMCVQHAEVESSFNFPDDTPTVPLSTFFETDGVDSVTFLDLDDVPEAPKLIQRQRSSSLLLRSPDEVASRLGDELDDTLMEDDMLAEFERNNTILDGFVEDLESMLWASPEELLELKSDLFNRLGEYDFLGDRLPTSRAMVIIVEMLQSRENGLLEAMFPILLAAGQRSSTCCSAICLLGSLPFIFEYATDPSYSADVQESAVTLILIMCLAKSRKGRSKPLQMFVAAGGLPVLVNILEHYPHATSPRLTGLVLRIVEAVFAFNGSTPASCFARILAQGEFLALLCRRYPLLESDDPDLTRLCRILEVFSQGFSVVKWKMALPEFVGAIFRRAKFPWQAAFGEEVLSEECLTLVVRAMANCAMEKAMVTLLWQSSLPEELMAFFRIGDPDFTVTEVHSLALSSLIALARVTTIDSAQRLGKLVPVLVYLIRRDTPLTGAAVALFLTTIGLSDDPDMESSLERNNATEILVRLMQTHERKEQIARAMAQWMARAGKTVESEVVANSGIISEAVTGILKGTDVGVKVTVVNQILAMCDGSLKLASALSMSAMVAQMKKMLLGDALAESPELRKGMVCVLMTLYEAAERPKAMIVFSRLDRIANSLIRDRSAAVRPLAKQLMQALACNYVI